MQIFKRDFKGEDRIFSISFRVIFPIDESLYFILVLGNLKFVKTGSSYGLSKLKIYSRPLAKVIVIRIES